MKTIPLFDPSQEGSCIVHGNTLSVLQSFPNEHVQCVVTSPPYWGLRDYDIVGQIGLEETLDEYIQNLTLVFSQVRRVLKPDGTLWLNIGDGFTSGNRRWRAPDKKNPARAMNVRPDTPDGLKPKDLLGIPWKLAFALQDDGWYLRSDIIWHKPNGMPESVKDRPTRVHEYIFLLTKSEKYYYDYESVREPVGNRTRNRRSVWSVNTQPFADAHFATFPPNLIKPCILAGSREQDLVLDPFFGSGTVGLVCQQHSRKFLGIELNPEYVQIAANRLRIDPSHIEIFEKEVPYEYAADD
ncbi:MAG: site-specific DNA-methyltransferase [Caldilineaceae bacterium]|nr:site-specific DNA-methyltransferase [Caldilineaceae bacterium]MBP8106291.1 site-specific DNA-methyltransferase [Caldilineaceae bacterium]MBP8122591.1 site-specific DNA-methyltransferase [Caldilineaceae bacterium]MBP9071153.1 site-specific DNA-methyltransferase [Caldilineaceae bacterium]